MLPVGSGSLIAAMVGERAPIAARSTPRHPATRPAGGVAAVRPVARGARCVGSGEQRRRHAVAEEAPARGERELVPVPLGQARAARAGRARRRRARARAPRARAARRGAGPSITRSVSRISARELLELARRPPARLERRQVAAERRCVPPAPILDCADRAHAEAEVVVPEPVAEVVPRPQVAARLRRSGARQKFAVSYQR